jgi:hypothetical protein
VRRVYPSAPGSPLNDQQLAKVQEARTALFAVLQNLRNRTLSFSRNQNQVRHLRTSLSALICHSPCKQWLDMALLKILVYQKPGALCELLCEGKYDVRVHSLQMFVWGSQQEQVPLCDIDWLGLESSSLYRSLSSVYRSAQQYERALDICKSYVAPGRGWECAMELTTVSGWGQAR